MVKPMIGRRATYEDLLAVPDHQVAELIDGELHVNPRPASRHALTSSTMGFDLGGPFHGERGSPGGWWILFEPELHLGRDVVVPDLAAWRRERMPFIPDVPYFTLAPDWVCEVISPGTESLDRVQKRQIYAREGVAHLWLVNPLPMTVEVDTLTGAGWLLDSSHHGSERVRLPPFDAVELDLGRWWLAPPDPE